MGVAAALMVTSCAALSVARAAASVTASGCKATTTVGAQIGMSPVSPGGPSSLRVACVLDSRTGSSQVSSQFTVHDFSNAVWHNGAAREIRNVGTVPTGSSTFTMTSCAGTGITGWVNRPIIGSGIAPYTFVESISPSCLVTLNRPTVGTVGDGTFFKLDNASARGVVDGVTDGTTTVTSATANFTADDVGLSVSGTLIPPGTTIGGVTDANTITLSQAATGAASAQVLAFGNTLEVTTARFVHDATYTAPNKISSAAAKFRASDVGLPIYPQGINFVVYIASVSGNTAIVNGTPLSTDVSLHAVAIGDPSTSAPTTGSNVASLALQLALDPTLVPGSAPCSADTATSVVLNGIWVSPDQTALLQNTYFDQPANTKAIGMIQFQMSTAFALRAYVVERRPLTPGDPNGDGHYDVVFPNVPFSMGLCASDPASPGVGISLGVSAFQTGCCTDGFTRPGTSQLRAIRATQSGASTTAFVRSDDGIHTWSGSEFERLCVIPAGPPPVGFGCGSG
jgi:hypothetical protein